jgi:flagella basal body P-ring formation protein FlgA
MIVILLISILLTPQSFSNINEKNNSFAEKECQIKFPEQIFIDDHCENLKNKAYTSIEFSFCSEEIIKEVTNNLCNTQGLIPSSQLIDVKKFKNNILVIPHLVSVYSLNEIMNEVSQEVFDEDYKITSIDKLSPSLFSSIQQSSLNDLKKSFKTSLLNTKFNPGRKTVEINLENHNHYLTLTLAKKYSGFKLLSLKNNKDELLPTDLEEIHFYSEKEINPFTHNDKIVHYQLVQRLYPETILENKHLQLKQIVKINSFVTVHVLKNDLFLKTIGKATGAGRLGDTITIINPQTSKKFMAQVIDSNTVELKL